MDGSSNKIHYIFYTLFIKNITSSFRRKPPPPPPIETRSLKHPIRIKVNEGVKNKQIFTGAFLLKLEVIF